MMKQKLQVALLVAASIAAAGCSDFLTGPGLDNNPNAPSTATPNVLLTGITANQIVNLNGDIARNGSIFVQQMAGTGSQYLSIAHYNLTENDLNQVWPAFYQSGGLLDLRKLQAMTRARGDSVYLGVAQVWEALSMGTLADAFGDIPYSEALTSVATPKLDRQQDVYAALQLLLDSAIVNLQGRGPGPQDVDLVYGGDPQAWIEAAHTLKARLYLHTAEVVGAPAYAAALAEARQGISTPAHDFTLYASSKPGEQNVWYQFEVQRDGYIRAGRNLVDLMRARGDSVRLAEYFAPAKNGTIGGAATTDKDDPNTQSWLNESGWGAADFRTPVLTWAENQLIIAEALYQAGDELNARAALNAVRQAAGLAPVLPTVTGVPLLRAIMEEKYVALFLNPEAWNDWKRTCYPAITGYNGKEIPARLYYPGSERNANPNIPEPGVGSNGTHNWNDPNGCA